MGGAPKPYMILEGMRVEHGPTVTAGGGGLLRPDSTPRASPSLAACLQCAFTPLAGGRRRQRRTSSMVHGKNRIPYWIDRRLNGLAGPEYHAIISFGLPIDA